MPVRQRRPVRFLIVDEGALAAFFSEFFLRIGRVAKDHDSGFTFNMHQVDDPEHAYDYLTLRGVDIVIGRWVYPKSRCTGRELYDHALRILPGEWPHIYILDTMDDARQQELTDAFAETVASGLIVQWFDKRSPKAPYDLCRAMKASVAHVLNTVLERY